MTPKKRCSKCNRLLEINSTNFYRDSRTKDGFRADCKQCNNKQKQTYYQENIDKRREYIRKNKEILKRKRKIYNSIQEHQNQKRITNKKIKDRKNDEYWSNYHKIHHWIKKHKPKQSYCSICNEFYDNLELANISGEYKKDINDYMWVCRSCHFVYDKNEKVPIMII